MAQRLVLVDDTNPNIQYSGPWFTAQNTQLNTGNFGPPFKNTLHGVDVDASFSYSFSGSSIYVLGTSIISTNSSGFQDPSWECFIDNNSIGSNPVTQSDLNNWVLCHDTQLQDGPHVLTVKATVSNQQTFWFDEIEYLPSSNVPLDQAMMRISSNDPILQYSSGWSSFNNNFVNLTQTGGSTLTYQFSGVSSLSWFSYIPSNYPQFATSATYSIDGQSPSNFLVPASSSELYNQVLFQTGQLSTGQHTLVVTYQGNSGTAPLVLNYLVIQNAASTSTSSNGGIFTQSISSSPSGSTANPATNANNTASTSAPPSSYIATGVTTVVSGVTSIISSGIPSNGSSSSSSASDLGSSTSTKPRLGVILGGALGGFILLLLLIIMLLFKRRRNNQGAQILTDESPPHTPRRVTDPLMVSPFRTTPTANHTLDDQSFTTRSFASKFTQGGRRTDDLITSNIMRSTSPTDAPSPVSQSSAIGISSLSDVPLAVLPTSGSGVTTKAREAEMVQRSATPQGGYSRVLRYEDSGIRMPPGEESFVELPPSYSPD